MRHLPSTTDAFLTGLGGTLDLFGKSRLWTGARLYRWQSSPTSEANAWALGSDFQQLGRDFDHALGTMTWEHQRPSLRTPRGEPRSRRARAFANR